MLILQKIANLQNFLQNKQRDVRHPERNFAESSFLMSRKFERQGCEWYGVKPDGLNRFLQIRGFIVEQDSEPLYELHAVLISSIKSILSSISLAADEQLLIQW